MATTKAEPRFLILEEKCRCRRALRIRVNFDFVNFMRAASRALGREFDGPVVSHSCRDCGHITHVSAASWYLTGIVDET